MTDTLDQIQILLRSIDVSRADEIQLARTIASLRRYQRTIDSTLMAAASRTSELYEKGESGTPEEVLGSGGSVSSKTAQNDAKRARTGRRLPKLGDAFSKGDIGGDHLDAAGRHLNGLSDEELEFVDQDALADAACSQTPDAFGRTAKTIADRAKNDWGLGRAVEDRKKSELKWWRNRSTGMGHFSGCIDPERFSVFQALLNAEMKALANDRKADQRDGGPPVKLDGHLAIDAMVSLLERGGTNQAGATRPLVNLHADYQSAAHGPHDNGTSETSDGSHLAPEQLQRLLCDSVIQAVIFDADGNVLNVGRRYRTATDKQWAGIRSLHRTCAFDQCQRPIDHCQAHHVDYWEDGGATDIDNLVPLCSHHHHRVHDEKWQLKLLPDRTLKIYRPDGHHWATAHPDRPPGTRPPGTKPPDRC